jgi:hypothetical protein
MLARRVVSPATFETEIVNGTSGLTLRLYEIEDYIIGTHGGLKLGDLPPSSGGKSFYRYRFKNQMITFMCVEVYYKENGNRGGKFKSTNLSISIEDLRIFSKVTVIDSTDQAGQSSEAGRHGRNFDLQYDEQR